METTAETKILKFTKKQAEASRTADNNTITLYGGAIRGGKTYWLILKIWVLALIYPKSRWVIIRASVPTLASTTLVSFNSLLEFGLQNDVQDWNAQMKICTLYNGSQIIFMAESYQDDKELNRFRGLEINGAGLDEINELQEQTFHKVIERSGSWNGSPGCPIKILATCNPTQNWVKEKFYDRWKNGTLPTGWAYVPARIEDNPHLSLSYLDSLRLLPLYQYKVFVEGEWDLALKTGGEFYKSFELDKHVGTCNYNPLLALHISFDENVNPFLPIGIFQIEGKELRMIEEIASYTPNNTVEAACDEIKKRYPNHNAGMFIYGDATSQKQDTKLEQGYNFFRLITDYLSTFKPQLRVAKSNPSVVMRGSWINSVFEKERGGIKVIIGNNCKKTINDFINLKEASDGTKFKETAVDPITKVRSQKVGHFSDLFDYLICFAFANEFSSYQTGGGILITTGKNKPSKNSY